jgi:PncC family amidohydrolase
MNGDLARLANATVRALVARGETVSSAESCTGGLITKVITDIPGSSAVLTGGCVSYTNEVKMNVLGVDPDIIARVSEVSAECAAAMARGAGEKFGSTYALSTTGYAGPTGGTEKDPVGTVYLALVTPDGVIGERFCAPAGSTREEVREMATARALEMLLECIKK